MVDLSKAYGRINISFLCDELNAIYLPGLIVVLSEFMGKNTFVCPTYEGSLNDEWKVGNGVRQWVITSGNVFNFYLNEVLTDLADLSLGCKLNGNRVNICCYDDDIALLAPAKNALQFMLDILAPKLENLPSKSMLKSIVILSSIIKTGGLQITHRYKVSPWNKSVNVFAWV